MTIGDAGICGLSLIPVRNEINPISFRNGLICTRQGVCVEYRHSKEIACIFFIQQDLITSRDFSFPLAIRSVGVCL
jgi:hypothetical protein